MKVVASNQEYRWRKEELLKGSMLVGKTIVNIEGLTKESDEVVFTLDTGEKLNMYHEQDCCEYVRVVDICGDVDNLLGSPLTMYEEASRTADEDECSECGTWTFYKLATIKGYVDLRWLGESNGYYSESVTVELLK